MKTLTNILTALIYLVLLSGAVWLLLWMWLQIRGLGV